jgi:hypothetical protein
MPDDLNFDHANYEQPNFKQPRENLTSVCLPNNTKVSARTIKRSALTKLAMVALGICFVLQCSRPLAAQQLAGSAVRAQLTLNGMWSYVLNQSQSSIPSSGWIPARVPAMPIEDGTSSVWYQRTLNVPSTWAQPGRSFFLELEKTGHYAAIYINGTQIGEHFGQYSPFEVDITSALVPGQINTIDIYVHKADTTYVRAGVNINQSSCPVLNPDCIGNAYRSAAYRPPPNTPFVQRNWVGLVGDVTFSWRPTENVSDIFVVTSVRNSTITANLQIVNANSGKTTARATVLDGKNVVLMLPAQPVVSGVATLQAPWTNPILWGPSPYGQPKLYMLQTQILESGVVVDTTYTKFGFREVWDEGKTTYLNGIPLWMSGYLMTRLAPVRYLNDRRGEAFQLYVLESAGLNLFQDHWDSDGRPFLDLADEMGVLVLGAFYCDGRPEGQSQVDDPTAWNNWMVATATEWFQDVKNHPSIIVWRPVDALPKKARANTLGPLLNQLIHKVDLSNRPIADDTELTDIKVRTENIDNPHDTLCDDGDVMADELAKTTIPLFTREITGTPDSPCLASFMNSYYTKAFEGGGIGLMQGLWDMSNDSSFTPSWFSISGVGNRTTAPVTMPNWITEQFTPTPLAVQLTGLFEEFVQPSPLSTSPTSGEYKTSSIPLDVQSAFLVSADGNANPTGVVVAEDGSGTAWFVVPQPGNYQLNYTSGGVDFVQHVVVNAPASFARHEQARPSIK